MKNNLVTILRITRPALGSFVKNIFEAEGIECFFTNEGLTLGSIYNPDEVILKVKSYQSELAIKTLLHIQKDFDLETIQKDTSESKIKKMLVPVKLVDNCIEICKYAIQLAKEINAEIKLLYVYPDPIIAEHERHTVSWEKHMKLELLEAHKNAQIRLVEFSDELKKQLPDNLLEKVKLHYRILKGTPVNVITDASQRYEPDLILMGTKRKKDLGNEFLEKTILKIIENSNCPILAVPFTATFKENQKIKVMYATDFYENDNSSLNKLLNILEPFEKEIHCIHFDLNDDIHHQKKVNELNKMLAKDYKEYNIHCELFKSDNVSKGFHDFVEKNDIDIISFSKMKRSLIYKIIHPSRLKNLVTIDKVPILIFPV